MHHLTRGESKRQYSRVAGSDWSFARSVRRRSSELGGGLVGSRGKSRSRGGMLCRLLLGSRSVCHYSLEFKSELFGLRVDLVGMTDEHSHEGDDCFL